MRKFLFLITAVAFMFTACEKDQNEAIQNDAQNGATIEFKIDQTDFGYKNTVPMCLDDELITMDYVRFSVLNADLVTTTYKSLIYVIDGEYLTQVIKLDTGAYELTSFTVFHDAGVIGDESDDVIIRAAPLPGSEYHDLMMYKLNLAFDVKAFYKQQFEIDVLCFEELFYEQFGFTWFQFNDVRIEQVCVFGDICVFNSEDFVGSIYETQASGIQLDLPAIFEVRVYKEGVEIPLRVFSNIEWLGEGACLPVYWPNRMDVEETFSFEIWAWLPLVNGGFDYVLVDTWNFLDGDGPVTGEDGVAEFVLGDCIWGETDYPLPAYNALWGK